MKRRHCGLRNIRPQLHGGNCGAGVPPAAPANAKGVQARRLHHKTATTLITSRVFFTAIVLCIAGFAASATAGSIWQKSSVRTQALFVDDTARKVGDNITIVINERGVIKNATKRGLDKKSERSAAVTGKQDVINTADAATGKLFSLTDPLNVALEAETKFDGNANFDSDRQVTDMITATVTDVMPNGNLVVLGSRTREVEGDKQIIQVSGIVRVSDISFANTVASEKIADFNVVYKHTGMENKFTKPGWLDRILNFINPF